MLGHSPSPSPIPVRPFVTEAVLRTPIVIIAEPVDEPEVDVTAYTLAVFFPAALIWCAAILVWCLFENGVL